MAWKIVVDRMLCEANAVCESLLPEVFEVTAADELVIHDERPPDELRSKVQEAVRSCPKNALSIVED